MADELRQLCIIKWPHFWQKRLKRNERNLDEHFFPIGWNIFEVFFSILLQPTNHRPVSCRQLREKSEPIWTVDCCVSSASGIFRTKVELLSEWDVKVLANLGLGKISNIHFSKSWKLNGEISKWKNWDDDSVLSVTLTHHASQQLTGRLWLLCCITTWPNSAMNYDLINYRIWMLSLTKIELYGQLFRYYWMFDCLQTDCGLERFFIFFGEICVSYCGSSSVTFDCDPSGIWIFE